MKKPAAKRKHVLNKMAERASGDDEDASEDAQLDFEPPAKELFGEWQTEPYVPPVANGGKVKNYFRNAKPESAPMADPTCNPTFTTQTFSLVGRSLVFALKVIRILWRSGALAWFLQAV